MIRYNTDCPYCHDIFDQYCNLFKGYKNCDKSYCEVLKILKENEQLKQGLSLYKKALELFVNWADECDFGYDNLGDLYSEYKDEVESLKYQEGLIHIAVSEAKKELDK